MATLNHSEYFRGFFNDMDILVSKNIQLLGCKEKKPVCLLLVKNYLRCWQNCVLNPNNFSRRLLSSNCIIKRSLTLKWLAQEIPFKQAKKFSLASPFCRQSFWYQSTRMARLSTCRHLVLKHLGIYSAIVLLKMTITTLSRDVTIFFPKFPFKARKKHSLHD